MLKPLLVESSLKIVAVLLEIRCRRVDYELLPTKSPSVHIFW